MSIIRGDESPQSIFPKVIKYTFPEEKYKELLKLLNLTNQNEPSDEDMKVILVNATYLFLTGEWSQDDLSAVANKLWFDKQEKFDELGSALYECAEMMFYVRNIYNPLSPNFRGNFEEFMITTIKFYEKYIEDVVK
ncbi:MAG: hypothetical protein WDZ94_01935 [Patescibacteria group bacterium]